MSKLTPFQFSERQKWIMYLEATRLPQCVYALRRSVWDTDESCWVDGFCVFGVYAYYTQGTVWEFDQYSGIYYLDKIFQRGLPVYLAERVGLHIFQHMQLARMNDEEGYSFYDIAQWMKHHYL